MRSLEVLVDVSRVCRVWVSTRAWGYRCSCDLFWREGNFDAWFGSDPRSFVGWRGAFAVVAAVVATAAVGAAAVVFVVSGSRFR